MKTKKTTWLITTKTNLHVGDDSSSSYGLIDKSVQRDALMKLPCINASSLKGALNEFCSHNTDFDSTDLIRIFGGDKRKKSSETKKGTTLFFDAGILFLPVQDDECLYKLAYCDEVLDQFVEKANLFGAAVTKEQLKAGKQNLVRKTKEEFVQLCSDDELPIIARNVLDNGESKNLWYEQVIPAETVFYTFLQSPIQSPDSDSMKTLESELENQIVQIGANATIGYGYCKFNKIAAV